MTLAFVGPGKKRGTSAESADAGTLPVACRFLDVIYKLRASWVDLGLLHSVFSCCVVFDSCLEEFPPSQERS